MITKKVIDELYRRFRKRPACIEHLDIGLLFDYASEYHNITIDGDGNIIIDSIDEQSPFHKISLDRVHGFYHFDDVIAIVLHSSIIFLNKHDNGVNVHIKFDKPSLWERVKWKFNNG